VSGSRWEVGSAFPLVLPTGDGWPGPPEPFRLYGSGGQALVALLTFGRREYGWTAVHLPEYYCPEMVDDLSGVLPVRRYDAGPAGAGAPPAATPTEVVVLVSYFGTAPTPLEPGEPASTGTGTGEPAAVGSRTGTGAALIVDATHDPLAPWLGQCRADYIFASLRKTLPLPDGGALWSTTGRDLPPEAPPTERHLLGTGKLLSAMCLKAAYLGGAALRKENYLALYAAGEQHLRGGTVSGISEFSAGLLRALPVERLRERRIDNAAVLAAGLRTTAGLTARAHPYGVLVECDSAAQRESVRRHLISQDVYPAVLWTLRPDEASARHVDFADRMLLLHSDARWQERDMRRVAVLVREAAERSRSLGRTPSGPPPRPRQVVRPGPRRAGDGVRPTETPW